MRVIIQLKESCGGRRYDINATNPNNVSYSALIDSWRQLLDRASILSFEDIGLIVPVENIAFLLLEK